MDNGAHNLPPGPFELASDQPAPPAAQHRQDNIVHVIHRRLRGRYHWAAIAAVLFALPLAILGYNAREPKYTSTAIVQISPTRTIILKGIDENQQLANFDSLVAAEARFIQSRRVLDRAVENPELVRAGWPVGPEGVAQLQRALQVMSRRGEQIIEVYVTHTDAVLAQRANRAVLDSYKELFLEKTDILWIRRDQQLVARERDLTQQLAESQARLLKLSQDQSLESIRLAHQGRVRLVEDLDQQINQLEQAINEATVRGGKPLTDDERLSRSIDMLAGSDQRLADLRELEFALRNQIESDEKKYGARHRHIINLKNELGSTQAQIRSRLQSLLAQRSDNGDMDIADLGQFTINQLNEYRARLDKQRAVARAEAAELNQRRMEIDSIEADMTRIRKQRDEAVARMDELNVEKGPGGENAPSRVTIVQPGDLDTTPDDKRLVTAVAGAMFGGFLGFALVFGLGLLDRGYRYIDDLESDALSAPLLGTLPDLAIRTPEQEEMAALSVHHLRNMLVLQGDQSRSDCRVWTVTSAAAGDGKTSLTLALGMSFAVSGQRTLLFDADLVGRGLTRELKMDRMRGLCQSIAAGAAEDEIQKMPVDNFWFLPAGVPDVEAKHLSRASMEKIFTSLRKQFDTIIVDTGPLLGSLEANLAASLSDGVVLCISRGQSSKFVNACLERLRRMGAPIAGLVFNRAKASDFSKSVSAGSVCSQSLRPPGPGEKPREAEARRGARGALVRAVIGSGDAHSSAESHRTVTSEPKA